MAHTGKAEKLSITLPSEMLMSIKNKVHKGLYGSISEVIRDAMRVWQKQDDEHQARLKAIRERIECSANSGESVPIDEVFKRLENKHKRVIGVSIDEEI